MGTALITARTNSLQTEDLRGARRCARGFGILPPREMESQAETAHPQAVILDHFMTSSCGTSFMTLTSVSTAQPDLYYKARVAPHPGSPPPNADMHSSALAG